MSDDALPSVEDDQRRLIEVRKEGGFVVRRDVEGDPPVEVGIDLLKARIEQHVPISLLHLRGMPWARIGEFVGQTSLAVTANTYTHVLTDETELDYAELLEAA